MDSLQKQVTIVNAKIDALYQVVEQMNLQVSEVLSEAKLISAKNSTPSRDGTESPVASSYPHSDNMIKHKDVLADEKQFEGGRQNGERQLSPEIQIQRLTAQLTAAYNRIADLEERLLSQRITNLS